MSEAHLDHPGEWSWFAGCGPHQVVGPCPHIRCSHADMHTVAYGPDFEHYELVTCDVTDGCAGGCRGWTAEYPPEEAMRRDVPPVTFPDQHLGWLQIAPTP